MIRSLFILVAGSLILAALLTPFVFSGLQWAIPAFSPPFSRVFDRCAMVAVVIMLLCLRRSFSLSFLKEFFTQGTWKCRVGGVVVAALTALIPALCVFPLVIGNDALIWSTLGAGKVALKIFLFVPAAVLISILEEAFFRVLLFNQIRSNLLKRPTSVMLAVGIASAVSSFIYASVHFITPLKEFKYQQFSPFAGFYYLGSVTERLLSSDVLFAWFGLFLVGLGLCFLLWQTGSVYLCMGLHVGWILALKASFYASDVAPGYQFAVALGRRYFLLSSPLTWGAIVISLALIFFFRKSLPLSKSPTV